MNNPGIGRFIYMVHINYGTVRKERSITQVGLFISMVHINYGTVRKVNNQGRTVYLHGPYQLWYCTEGQ